jgi:hypothetical protein
MAFPNVNVSISLSALFESIIVIIAESLDFAAIQSFDDMIQLIVYLIDQLMIHQDLLMIH